MINRKLLYFELHYVYYKLNKKVSKTHKPHNNRKVVFCDLKENGFVLSKNKERTDVLNKWVSIKKELLKKMKNPKEDEDFIKIRMH